MNNSLNNQQVVLVSLFQQSQLPNQSSLEKGKLGIPIQV